MIDNLRRTVTAPLALATLLLAWTVSSASAVWWSALVVASVLVPAAMPVVAGLIPHRTGISKRSHLRDVGGDLVVATAQVILEVTFLAHQARADARRRRPDAGAAVHHTATPPRMADRRASEGASATSTSVASTGGWRAA